jgi:hypothetical protein
LVAIASLEGVEAGDPLELRRPDGTAIRTTLYAFDWLRLLTEPRIDPRVGSTLRGTGGGILGA